MIPLERRDEIAPTQAHIHIGLIQIPDSCRDTYVFLVLLVIVVIDYFIVVTVLVGDVSLVVTAVEA